MKTVKYVGRARRQDRGVTSDIRGALCLLSAYLGECIDTLNAATAEPLPRGGKNK